MYIYMNIISKKSHILPYVSLIQGVFNSFTSLRDGGHTRTLDTCVYIYMREVLKNRTLGAC